MSSLEDSPVNNLADKVIQANKRDSSIHKEEQKLDDLGLLLPDTDSEFDWCEYLTIRIVYINPNMYTFRNLLWIHNEMIKENKSSYYRLAKYPKQITDSECQYVWRRLKEILPQLDTDVISVLPGVTFNMRTGELKYEDVRTITPWEDENA